MKTLIAALALLIAAPAASAQESTPRTAHAETPREQWQRVDDIFREMGVTAGSHVADIGAGNGFFTTRLAKAVGANGRVYAVDVNPVSLRELKAALGTDSSNVEMIRGEENDPRLPANQLDAALVVNAYHEFAEHQAMLRAIFAALKPGGRLVIVEPAPARTTGATRAEQEKRHTIAMPFVEEDLRDAGYEIVARTADFATRPTHMERGTSVSHVEWLLVGRKPGLN